MDLIMLISDYIFM